MEPWLNRASEAFWKNVGMRLPFPRDLEEVLSLAYPVSCLPLAQLSVGTVQQWLEGQGVGYQFLCGDRSLSGCVVAARGKALIFTRQEDPVEERRFTVAHEFAHYLLDYLAPRQKAVSALGPSILEALDGERNPTMEERLSAALDGINLGIYFNLMPRAPEGEIADGFVLKAETRADRFALELLAPLRSVQAQLTKAPERDFDRRRHVALQILTAYYGLPGPVARQYARSLVRPQVRSTAEWLGL